MPGLVTRSGPIKIILVCTLIVLVALSPVGNAFVMSTCSNGSCGDIDVSPGKYAKELGVDFPNFGAVKLSYPNSSILTNSIGDLLFLVNLTKVGYYNSIDIYIPPDFTGLTISSVWTSFTNNYDPNSISLSRLSSNDRIGPNLWRVSVQNLTVTDGTPDVASRIFAANKTQYVRIFQVTSPSIAGRYFFKTFINGTSTGAGNFPTVVVKASRDPAYISGTLRDLGNTNPSLAGQPISIPNGTGARILATGIDYLGRSVAAQTFINSTAKGNYTLFGVAPGTYNLTAYAAGYIPTTTLFIVSVLAAQSLVGVDIYLKHSVDVTGTVLSIGANGLPINWQAANRSAIRIEVLAPDGAIAASTPPPYGPFFSVRNDTDHFEFSIQWQVGLDGRIPQDFANYTSGLVAGDYSLRAYVNAYAQFEDSLIHVGNDTTLVASVVRLIRLGSFIVTVHFKDFSSSLQDTSIRENGSLTVQAYDQQGNVGGRGATRVALNTPPYLSPTVTFPCLPGTYHIYASFSPSRGSDDFYQTEDVLGTIELGSDAMVSLAIVRAGGMSLTLYSVDAENPGVLRPWAFPGYVINLKIVDSKGNVYTTNATQQAGDLGVARVFYSGLLTDYYVITAETFGYSQRQLSTAFVAMGGIGDVSVWMLQDSRIDLTIVFKKESLLSLIDSTQPFAQPINHLDSTPARVEIFDSYGNFVGANITYIPNLTAAAEITLAGFHRYFGDPRLTWSGFYDTTDAIQQDEGGLPPGNYLIRIWIDGYYQSQLIPVTLPPRQDVSLVTSVDRSSRVSGIVLGPDFYGKALLLSWAVIDLEPGNFTTFSLDGKYQLWMPPGSYNMGVSLAGYSTYTARFEVPPGSDLRVDIWLDNPSSSLSTQVGLSTGSWLILTPLTRLASISRAAKVHLNQFCE